jgi:hypothetical protein
MSKFKICLNDKNLKENNDLSFECDHRSIQNLEIDCNLKRSVNSRVIEMLLQINTQFLVDFRLRNVKVRNISKEASIILPNLKSLTLQNVNENFIKLIFMNLKSLEQLTLNNIDYNENFIKRISKQSNLRKLKLIDIIFFGYKLDGIEPTLVELKNLNHLEVSFHFDNNSNYHNEIQEVLQNFSLKSIKSLKLVGARGQILSFYLKKCENLEKLELINLWAKDLDEIEICHLPLELYVQNYHYMDEIKWKKKFRKLKSIIVGKIEPNDTNKYHADENQTFLKMMKLSGRRMISNNLFSMKKIVMGELDPLQRLSEDIHGLIFQHFDGKTSKTATEVSQNWNSFAVHSRALMDNIQLRIPNSARNDKMMNNSDRRYRNVIVHNDNLTMVKSFSQYLKNLTITTSMKDVSPKVSSFSFRNLEVLVIKKEAVYYTYNKIDELLNCFVRCERLKTLDIRDSVDDDTIDILLEILYKNSNLRKLRIEMCKSHKKFLTPELCQRVGFYLESFSFGIPEDPILSPNDLLEYETNMINFLKMHNETLLELSLSRTTTEIYNTVFTSFTMIEHFYGFGLSLNDNLTTEECKTISSFVLPLPANRHADIERIVNQLPFLEYLYVMGIDLDVLRSTALRLPFLNVLSYTFEVENCLQFYPMLTVDNEYIPNPDVKFFKVQNVTYGNCKFKNIFDPWIYSI